LREFAASIDEALQRGLRPQEEFAGGTAFLQECYNLKPFQGGLEAWESPYDPFEGTVETNWPWPQIKFLADSFFLCREDVIQKVNTSVSPWTLSLVDLYDPKNPSMTVSVPEGGGTWHSAQSEEAWYLFKDNATAFKLGLSDKVYLDTTVPISTGTFHKGRFVIGGFESGSFWNEFESIFNTWTSEYEDDIPFSFGDVDENWIAWSSVGGGDLPAWLFYPDDVRARTGLTEDRFVKRLLRNELGFMPMPFDGKVLNIKHYSEDLLIVYGEDGVAAIQLSGTQLRGEDFATSTYGVREVSSAGLASRDAVAATEGQHIFLDDEGQLWALSGQLELQKLDYREHLRDLVGGEVVGVYNEFEEEFILSSQDLGYVFTGEGLAEHKDRLTTLSSRGSQPVALSHDPGSDRAYFQTTPVDFGTAGRKRLENIQVRGARFTNARSEVESFHGLEDVSPSKQEVPHNREGIGHHYISGNRFNITVSLRPEQGARIQSLSVRYQLEDKRAIRGPTNADTS